MGQSTFLERGVGSVGLVQADVTGNKIGVGSAILAGDPNFFHGLSHSCSYCPYGLVGSTRKAYGVASFV